MSKKFMRDKALPLWIFLFCYILELGLWGHLIGLQVFPAQEKQRSGNYYTKEDCRKSVMRYSRLCAMLQEQGMHVICCTISMLDSVRDWNRYNILNYREMIHFG